MNRRMTLLFGATVSLVLFVLMALTIRGTAPWNDEGTQQSVDAANDQSAMVDALLDGQVVPFEVLGILLTAAMIGALVIARPLDAVEDGSHYSHPTEAQVAESDHASDPEAHALRNPAAIAAPAPTSPAKEGSP